LKRNAKSLHVLVNTSTTSTPPPPPPPQATALKLHATKGELEQVLQQAQARLEAGLAPTDEADMEWAALLRQQQTLEELKAQRDQVFVPLLLPSLSSA
jgi:outer membrane protein TolC